jgi:hypothetical protein
VLGRVVVEKKIRKLNIENSSQSTARRQWTDHYGKHVVINDVPGLFVIEGIDNFIESVVFIAV